MSVPTTSSKRDAAFERLLHETTRYKERRAEGSLHYHDRHKVEGAAIELGEMVRATGYQGRCNEATD
jgi:hypothetical protein